MITHQLGLSSMRDLLLPLSTSSNSFTFPRFIENVAKSSEETIRNCHSRFCSSCGIKLQKILATKAEVICIDEMRKMWVPRESPS